jgi:hypothetical protein
MNGRDRLLAAWAQYLADAAGSGVLTGRACSIARIETIAGPRAGALEIFAGLESGRLLRTLAKDNAAILRQFIPWTFTGEPQAFMSGRRVRVEAGWPSHLADTLIRLDKLNKRPEDGGRWAAGMSENGATIIPTLSDKTAHFLISGATGSGKSVTLRAAVLQLSRDPDNAIVLVDGKMGESLRMVERLPGVVGPCAVDGPTARNVLGWAAAEMRRRYQSGQRNGRVIVVVDEFQEFVDDEVFASLMRKLVAQGRAARVHCLLATQHPTVEAFGDSATRRNLTGKIALHVLDADASRVAVGGPTPRADHLLGAGDAYTIAPGACYRVQLAYVDEHEIGAAGYGSFTYPRWPEYEPESIGRDIPVGWSYDGDELAVSIVAAVEEKGRPWMVDRLCADGLGRPGAERAIRLLKLGRQAHDGLRERGYAVCLSGDAHTDSDEWAREVLLLCESA